MTIIRLLTAICLPKYMPTFSLCSASLLPLRRALLSRNCRDSNFGFRNETYSKRCTVHNQRHHLEHSNYYSKQNGKSSAYLLIVAYGRIINVDHFLSSSYAAIASPLTVFISLQMQTNSIRSFSLLLKGGNSPAYPG